MANSVAAKKTKTTKTAKKKSTATHQIRVYDHLTKQQKDILGEVANISMGNSATTLSMMLNHPVNISAPQVAVIHRSEALDDYDGVCTFVQIRYVKGLSGSNVFVLRDTDMLCITDMMMGGDGSNAGSELNEMHMSAAAEAMNQMMGASATSMSHMLAGTVDISTPSLSRIDVESVKAFEKLFDSPMDVFVRITFKIVIDDRIDSTMVQLYPIQFAVDMCNLFRKKRLDKKDTYAAPAE